MQNVFVTGGTGLVGAHLVQEVLREKPDAKVVVLARSMDPRSYFCEQGLDRRMLFVPLGCASGYQALTDGCEVTYSVGAFYHPEAERGIRWDDPAFSIDWPIKTGVILSAKDEAWPDFHV